MPDSPIAKPHGNPYHRLDGQFCSRSEMLGEIRSLALSGKYNSYEKLKRDFMEVDRKQDQLKWMEERYKNGNGPAWANTEELVEQEPLTYSSFDLEDEEFPRRNGIRRGLNARGDTNLKLVQLDAEGVYLSDALSQEEKDTLSGYQGTHYRWVNLYLMKGEDGLNEYLNHFTTPVDSSREAGIARYKNMAESVITRVDAIFATHNREENNQRLLFRAMAAPRGVNINDWIADNYKVGDEIVNKAYWSTSADSDNMLQQGDWLKENFGETAIFEIKSRKGLTLHNPKDTNSVTMLEREVLLNRNSKFKVIAISEASYESTLPVNYKSIVPTKARYPVIQLEEI